MRKAGGGGADRPLQPADRDPEGDEAEYAPGLVRVNIVDVGYEESAEDDRTPSIAVFVEDVCTVCDTVEKKYGFQPSSVRNQRENILMLVANIWSTLPERDEGPTKRERAINALHRHTLGSYEKWARGMQGLAREEMYMRQGRETADEHHLEDKLFEVALWWCIWGEAANMRFMPEFLAWVFHALVRERNNGDRAIDVLGKYDEGDGILRRIMRPMYNYVSEEAFKKDEAGNNVDHASKNNLDDINEYFWVSKGKTACRRPRYQLFGGGALDDKARGDGQPCEGIKQLIEQLKKEKKTYVERRGLHHSIKSNMRVLAFYLLFFQLIVTVAYHVPFEQSTLPLCPPQLRTDSCLSANSKAECVEKRTGCGWDKRPPPGDPSGIPSEQCFDTCTVQTDKDDCSAAGEGGCVWNKEMEECHMYSSKAPEVLLRNIDQTTYISCDLKTALCRYKDNKGTPITYSCLEHLDAHQVDLYRSYSGSFFETWPVVGRLLKQTDPEGSDLSWGHANQTHMFDSLWRGDDGSWKPKRDFLSHQGTFFTCGFNIDTVEGLEKAGSISHCCRVNLTKPDEQNHGFVSVWSEVDSCHWDMLELYKPEYSEALRDLEYTVVTLVLLRLIGELLGLTCIWNSSHMPGDVRQLWNQWRRWPFMITRLAMIVMYVILLAIMLAIMTDSEMTSMDEERSILNERTAFSLELFEWVCIAALLPELTFSANSALSFALRIMMQVPICLAWCVGKASGGACGDPNRIREWLIGENSLKSSLEWSFHKCTPRYARKIKGTMESDFSTSILYSLIWAVLLLSKAYFSYYFEIRLQVQNTGTTWVAIATPFAREEFDAMGSYWDKILVDSVRSSEGGVHVAEVVVLLTWVPTLIVFIMDAQIFFAFGQMVVGMVAGIHLKVGHVNTWADFQQKLVKKLLPRFAKNLDAATEVGLPSNDQRSTNWDLGTSKKRRSLASIPRGQATAGENLMDPINARSGSAHNTAPAAAVASQLGGRTAWEFRETRTFKRFVECWNMFIEKLRYDDYLSDREASLYKCICLDGYDERPLLPPMLTLNGIGTLLLEIDQLENQQKRFWYARTNYAKDQDHQKRGRTGEHWKKLTTGFMRQFKPGGRAEIREAVSGACALTIYLLKKLIPDTFQQDVDKIESWLKNLSLCDNDSPILKALLTDPARGSAKNTRTQLLDAIAAFAESLVAVCVPEDGKSKQCSLLFESDVWVSEGRSWGGTFRRTGDRPEMSEDKVVAAQKSTSTLLELLQKVCEGNGDKGFLPESKGDLPSSLKKLLSTDVLDEKKVDTVLDHFTRLSKTTTIRRAAVYLAHLCQTRRADAEPVSGEAQRRILTFASSLHMHMPEPKTVETMKSMTSFTPYLNETALYTRGDITGEQFNKASGEWEKKNDGRASILTYLQTVHPDQWNNLTERLGITEEAEKAGNTIPEWIWQDTGMATEVRLWASLRGQTLARTIHGVMQNEEALRLFARQEDHLRQQSEKPEKPKPDGPVWKSELLWERQAHLKFGYVVSCQIYGSWDDDNELKKSIDILMQIFPHLRIAYVNEEDDPEWRGPGVAVGFSGKLDDAEQTQLEQFALEEQTGTIQRCIDRKETQQESMYIVDVNGTPLRAKGSQLKATNQAEEKKYYSYLVRWSRSQKKVVKCYRIEQACNRGGKGNWGPAWLVGEGKPENQNHAIVFTRGQYLQTLDMNQDGYFEECLKTRNLLEQFAGAECRDEQQLRIIGFPEHPFSDTLSAVAEFSALTEFTFATLIQRTLGWPFDVRMHYGHPDIFDRVFHVTRGGISKPMKTLCVSEDIFGAFNSILKGGMVKYFEYIKQGKGKDLGFGACSLFEQKISSGNGEQALSRDYSRISEQMSITRLLSFFHSSNGFYWSNVLVIWATSWFIYGQIMISVVIPDEQRAALLTVTESVAFAFQLGLVLTVPLVAELILEKGPLAAMQQMLRVVFTGGPLFFMFHIRTKAYYYDRTLVLGGAGYKATGRGFVLEKEGFVGLFSMFHYSHLNYGATMVMNLMVYRFFTVSPESYGSVTWSTWLFAVDLLLAPFIFNCLALDRKAVETDLEQFSKFLWREAAETQNKNTGDAAKESWRVYFESENAVYQNIGLWTRLSLIARDLIWVVLPLAILLERNASATENVAGHFWRAVGVALGTVLTAVLSVLAMLGILSMFLRSSYRNSRYIRDWVVDPLYKCFENLRDGCLSNQSCHRLCGCFACCRDAQDVAASVRRYSLNVPDEASDSCCEKCCWQSPCCCDCIQMALRCYCFRARKIRRYALMAMFLLCLWTIVALFMDYGEPLEVVSIYIASFGYIISFVTNAVFYLGYRPEWLLFVYWVHDAVLGYAILAPFYLLSFFRVVSDAHMFLLYNSKLVEVLNMMTFDSGVLGVIKRKDRKEFLRTEALESVTSHKQMRSRSAPSRSFRVSQSASAGIEPEPEPEPEAYQSRSASPVRPGAGSINVSRAASPQPTVNGE